MRVPEREESRYIYRFLVRITRYFYAQWYLSSEELNRYRINICEAVYSMGRYKMEKIKQYVYENAFIHEKLWTVYEEIKDFKEVADLLAYLSVNCCHSPEHTLLHILRCSNKIRILNTDNPGVYLIYPVAPEKLPDTREGLVTIIKNFVRSYVLLILDINKEAMSLYDLYCLFIKEEYSYANASDYIFIKSLMEKKQLNMEDILLLANAGGINTAEGIFKDIIKTDYNRFYRIIDDYYGSKNWNDNEKIMAYIKLYDIYIRGKNARDIDRAIVLGDYILANIDRGVLHERQKASLRRIILRNKERLSYGI